MKAITLFGKNRNLRYRYQLLCEMRGLICNKINHKEGGQNTRNLFKSKEIMHAIAHGCYRLIIKMML